MLDRSLPLKTTKLCIQESYHDPVEFTFLAHPRNVEIIRSPFPLTDEQSVIEDNKIDEADAWIPNKYALPNIKICTIKAI